MTTAELRTKTLQIAGRFESSKCICGKWKGNRTAFCKPCYFSLPKQMQSNLWLNWNKGFIPAYLEAEEYLAKPKTD